MILVKVSFVVSVEDIDTGLDLNNKQAIVDLLNKAGGPGALFDSFTVDNIEATKEVEDTE